MELKALLYFEQKKFLKAKVLFEEVQNLSKKESCFRQIHLGRIEYELGQLPSSKQLLKKAVFSCQKENKQRVCSDQKNQQAYYFLAQVYKKQKQLKTMKYYLKLFIKNSNSKDPYYKEAKKILGI